MRTDLRRRVTRLEEAARPPQRALPSPSPYCPRCRRCGGLCVPSAAALGAIVRWATPDDFLCSCGTDCPTCGGPRSPMRLIEQRRAEA